MKEDGARDACDDADGGDGDGGKTRGRTTRRRARFERGVVVGFDGEGWTTTRRTNGGASGESGRARTKVFAG